MIYYDQVDYSLHLLSREIPDHFAIYGSASCHCDHTVHIAELVRARRNDGNGGNGGNDRKMIIDYVGDGGKSRGWTALWNAIFSTV